MGIKSCKLLSKDYWPHLMVLAGIIALGAYILALQLQIFSPMMKLWRTATSQDSSTTKQANPSTPQSNQAPELPADLQAAVNAAQAQPTVAPAVVIEYTGDRPTSNITAVPVDSVVAVTNLTDNPIIVNFSSGASMNLGSQGNLEYTVLRTGREDITFVDQETTRVLTLSVIGTD